MGEGLGYVLPVKKTGFANMAIQSEMTDPDRAYTSLAVLAYFCQFYINIQCNKKYISMVEFSKYKVLSMESKSQDGELKKLTVKTLLRSRLQTAMERANMPETALKLDEIPLNRSQNSLGVVYISAIALKLAKVCQQTPQAIATQLAETLQSMCHRDFAVTVAPSAIIEFEFTPPALAWWLQRLAQTPIPVTQSRIISPVLSADRLFPLQYSHARCCSLVRMANRDQLIANRPTRCRHNTANLVADSPQSLTLDRQRTTEINTSSRKQFNFPTIDSARQSSFCVWGVQPRKSDRLFQISK
ncbi:MAG: hypothetical protein ACM65K_26095 [Microcoleus sp.]